VWAGTFLTAMEMPGCSVSVMKLHPELVSLLDAPARTFAWPAAHLGRCSADIVLPKPVHEQTVESSNVLSGAKSEILETLLNAICDMEPELTEMDQVVGDGDLGFSLKRGAEAILGALSDLPAQP